jgi:chlorobactene glucosyltransferase
MLRRPRLASFEAVSGAHAPLVSVIVPARNEAVNVSVCLASLLNSLYPNYEIVVVDDDSTDGTGDIIRILADHADGRVVVVDGEPLPAGWLGKPWACWQGYQRARGDVLLFTDADTRHEEMLLGRAVGALQQREADMVSVMPRQVMIKLWERLILPHIFALISLRFMHLERVNRTRQPRHAIANGQFILIRRDAYEEIGGHEALKAEVVEDQRIAQRLVANGRRIFIAHAESLMETRMYRSLAGIVEGWTKNLAIGSRSAAPQWAEPAVPWLVAAFLIGMWVVPPVILITTLTTRLGGWVQGWSLAVTAASMLFWLIALALQRVPLPYVLSYPVGALIAAYLFVRSALRGPNVAWKGRDYTVERVRGRAGEGSIR